LSKTKGLKNKEKQNNFTNSVQVHIESVQLL
jgi:hypothetical protein